jgi:hypothetical protein
VLEGPVLRTTKKPGLNRTRTDGTGLSVSVLPIMGLVWSTVCTSRGEQQDRSKPVVTSLGLTYALQFILLVATDYIQ